MNLTEITYTKIKYIMRNFPEQGSSFVIGENKTKTIPQKSWKIHAKSVEGSVVHLCFVSRIPIINKRRTRNEHLFICFYHIRGDFNHF